MTPDAMLEIHALGTLLLTPCPADPREKVGSVKCQECRHFIEEKDNRVACGYPGVGERVS